MTKTTKTKRLGPGRYRMIDALGRSWTIALVNLWDGPGWTAWADWDDNIALDPRKTKRSAIRFVEQVTGRAVEKALMADTLEGAIARAMI